MASVEACYALPQWKYRRDIVRRIRQEPQGCGFCDCWEHGNIILPCKRSIPLDSEYSSLGSRTLCHVWSCTQTQHVDQGTDESKPPTIHYM